MKDKNRNQEVNGTESNGGKLERAKYGQHKESSSVNFTGSSDCNIGKTAVFLYRKDYAGKIFDPCLEEVNEFIYGECILAEDEDSFTVGRPDGKDSFVIMKYPELYCFFRIVDSGETDVVIGMITKYVYRLFRKLEGEYPFGLDIIEKFEESIDIASLDDFNTESEAEERAVLKKLKKTKFGRLNPR